MSIPTKSGVYLLCSADSFGKRVYKVGRSENLRQRLASYPPNFIVLGVFPCEDCEKLEAEIIKSFRATFKVYARNEYFEIDADYNSVSSVFCGVISKAGSSSTSIKISAPAKSVKSRTVDVPPSEEEDKKKRTEERKLTFKKDSESSVPQVVQELRSYILENFDGVITKKDMEEDVKAFNGLIIYIMQRIDLDDKSTLLKGLEPYLKEIVPNKEVKKYVSKFSGFDLRLINKTHQIKPSEVEKLYKKK